MLPHIDPKTRAANKRILIRVAAVMLVILAGAIVLRFALADPNPQPGTGSTFPPGAAAELHASPSGGTIQALI